MDALSRLNEMSPPDARAELLRCCASSRWADAMTRRRPFADAQAVFAAAEEIWRGLDAADWYEAFAGHPKIGDKGAVLAAHPATRNWAEGEQKGALGAAERVRAALAEGNRAYEQRFGYIFIVCATG